MTQRNKKFTGKVEETQIMKGQRASEDKQVSSPFLKGELKEDVPGEGGLDEPTKESQTHSRGGGGARGSNH